MHYLKTSYLLDDIIILKSISTFKIYNEILVYHLYKSCIIEGIVVSWLLLYIV